MVPPRAGARGGGTHCGRAVPARPHLRSVLPPSLVQARAAAVQMRCCCAAVCGGRGSVHAGLQGALLLHRSPLARCARAARSRPHRGAGTLPAAFAISNPMAARFCSCSIADYERLFREQGLTGGPAGPAAGAVATWPLRAWRCAGRWSWALVLGAETAPACNARALHAHASHGWAAHWHVFLAISEAASPPSPYQQTSAPPTGARRWRPSGGKSSRLPSRQRASRGCSRRGGPPSRAPWCGRARVPVLLAMCCCCMLPGSWGQAACIAAPGAAARPFCHLLRLRRCC